MRITGVYLTIIFILPCFEIKTLTKHDITKLSDFVDQVTPEGKITEN
jgi:hypothetical protein